MAELLHKTVTLTAAARSLASLLNITPGGADDVPLQGLSLQAGTANANGAFVGGPTVTTTDFGFRIPAAAAGVPAAPEHLRSPLRPVKLSEVYVVGTAGEKLHVCGFPW